MQVRLRVFRVRNAIPSVTLIQLYSRVEMLIAVNDCNASVCDG